jgi:hypothetical protein
MKTSIISKYLLLLQVLLLEFMSWGGTTGVCAVTLIYEDYVSSINELRKFFLNNQQDALIIQIYSVIKLYIFRASSLPIIRSFLQHIRQSSSILTLLGSGHQKPA